MVLVGESDGCSDKSRDGLRLGASVKALEGTELGMLEGRALGESDDGMSGKSKEAEMVAQQ